jgi:hypothetical protein
MIILFSGFTDDYLKNQIIHANNTVVTKVTQNPTHIIIKSTTKISKKIATYIESKPDGEIILMPLDEFISKYDFKLSLKPRKTYNKKTTIISDSSSSNED